MKISLRNIGKVREADIEINGITVIAGENNTGKSTIGKALFAVFNSFYNIDNQIYFEKIESIDNAINMLYRNTTNRLTRVFDSEEIAAQIINDYKSGTETFNVSSIIINYISEYDDNFEKKVMSEDMALISKKINDLLEISNDDFFKSSLQKRLSAEFNEQITNIYNTITGQLSLEIKGNNIDVLLSENEVTSISSKINLLTEAIYIDDPFILDDLRPNFYYRNKVISGHRAHLKYILSDLSKETNILEEIVTKNKLDNVLKAIELVCEGTIVRKNRSSYGYQRTETDKILDIKNLSTGMKAFVVLKKLLIDNKIASNGIIILDEPEIHLHPEWQLLFAEFIVILQKEFDLHILLNTHSPYFLNAIEVYSEKYVISGKCKYYLAENIDEFSYIKDVSDKIELIYEKLLGPFQRLENMRWSDE